MIFEGVNSKMYGGVYGPFLNLKIFWFRNNPSIANTSNLYIQIGDQMS